MATVADPPVSLAAVRAVFGAPAGTPLHAFVRGGAYVPDIALNAHVPTAPPVRLAGLARATNYAPVTVSVTPSPLSFVIPPSKPPGAQTRTLAVTAGGGTGGYADTYARAGGDAGAALVAGDGTANPTFRCTGSYWGGGIEPPEPFDYTDYWTVTVSDGITAQTLGFTITKNA